MRLIFAATHPTIPEFWGGQETSNQALALRLQRRGIATAIFAGRQAAAAPFTRDDVIGCPAYRAPEPVLGYPVALADWKPDVAVIPLGTASMPLVPLSLQAGAKVALYAASAEPYDFDINPVALPGVTLIANSDFTARRLQTLLGVDAPVVPPLIEPEAYRVAEGPHDAVLFVNPTLRKGVEIFFRLAAARPEIPFLAVESWSISDAWRAVLINRARALGNVALWPTDEDMREAYGRARLVLMPSTFEETFGRIVAEAQVSGIPALVAARGALPGTMGGGGIAVPIDVGIEPWIAALDRIWRAPTDFTTAAFAEAARPERAPETIVDRFLAVLEALPGIAR